MECWTAAAVVTQEVNCKSLRWALAKDRATPIRAVDKEKQPDNETFSNARCEYCGELIDLRTGKNKHLELDCKVLKDVRDKDDDGNPVKKLADRCLWLTCAKLGTKPVERSTPTNAKGRSELDGTENSRAVSADSQVT